MPLIGKYEFEFKPSEAGESEAPVEEIKKILSEYPDIEEVHETKNWIIANTKRKAGKIYYDIIQLLKERGIDVPVSPTGKYTIAIPKKLKPKSIHIVIGGVSIHEASSKKPLGLYIKVTGDTYPVKDTLKKLGFKYSYSNDWVKYYGMNKNEVINEVNELTQEALRKGVVVKVFPEASLKPKKEVGNISELINALLETYREKMEVELEEKRKEEEESMKYIAMKKPIITKYLHLKSTLHNLSTIDKLIREGKVKLEYRVGPHGEVEVCLVPLVNIYDELKDEYRVFRRELELLGFKEGWGTCRWKLEEPTEGEIRKLESELRDKEAFIYNFKNYLVTRNNKVALNYVESGDYLFKKEDGEYCFIPKKYIGSEWSNINKSFKRVGCYWNSRVRGWCCPKPPSEAIKKEYDSRVASVVKTVTME